MSTSPLVPRGPARAFIISQAPFKRSVISCFRRSSTLTSLAKYAWLYVV